MPARYYVTTVVSGQANAETTTTALAGTTEEPKRVVELWAVETTSTRQNNAVIRVYIDRERIASVPIRMALDQSTSQLYAQGALRIPLDIELAAGEQLIIGHVSGSTASEITYVVAYEVVV